MSHHLVVRVVSKFLIPFILLFGLYVQFHGDFGPGGGFQAGVIFAAAFVLYALVFGLENARRVVPPPIVAFGVGLGAFIFGGVGVVSILTGGNYLDYSTFAASPPAGQHIGIFAVELGVGITVASVMVMLFYLFAGRTRAFDPMEK